MTGSISVRTSKHNYSTMNSELIQINVEKINQYVELYCAILSTTVLHYQWGKIMHFQTQSKLYNSQIMLNYKYWSITYFVWLSGTCSNTNVRRTSSLDSFATTGLWLFVRLANSSATFELAKDSDVEVHQLLKGNVTAREEKSWQDHRRTSRLLLLHFHCSDIYINLWSYQTCAINLNRVHLLYTHMLHVLIWS